MSSDGDTLVHLDPDDPDGSDDPEGLGDPDGPTDLASTPTPAPKSKLRWRDLLSEAVAGMLQRPSRSALTALGTVLGVGTFVAVLGLTATATGQIGDRFNALTATEVTVEDTGGPDAAFTPSRSRPTPTPASRR